MSNADPAAPLAYLSGAIEYAPDHGRGWRLEITRWLETRGHRVYDPALDERKNLSDQELQGFRGWKTRDLPRFQATLRKIIAWDLDRIEHHSDYLIVYWDDAARQGAGTQAEITFAHRLGLPVLLVLGMPLAAASGWVLGCASEVCDNWQALQAAVPRYFPAGWARREGKSTVMAAGRD